MITVKMTDYIWPIRRSTVDSLLFKPALIRIIRLFELRSRSPWIWLPNSGLGADDKLNLPQLFEFLLLGEHLFSAIETLFPSKNQVSTFMPIYTLHALLNFFKSSIFSFGPENWRKQGILNFLLSPKLVSLSLWLCKYRTSLISESKISFW